ncbi:MAG TPA: hypothetical protein VJ850_00315 [Candidatus Limnocylindrales bacterium]|nr:hypothetical protein [Candidatus Limnocylindrales bacterium]
MDHVVVRTVSAPTETEARAMAVPVIDAFQLAGWELREELWVPGDRRPRLGESLLLSPESQLLLEDDGVLRLSFANADPLAIAPSASATDRKPDAFESLGGVRYRRLVPHWALSIVVGIIGFLLFVAVASTMPNSPFAAAPTPDGGICPVGWIPGKDIVNGVMVDDGSCVRLP